MSFLYFLESIRNPVLDFFFSTITYCGDEIIFMALGMIFFWCINKFQGYYLLCVGFLGTVINQFLKMLFRIPRPWIKDPNFTIVESAREAATGYSFPSGHTQTSVGLFGGLARTNKNLAVRIVSIALCVLVPLSRLYLGVHTPLDVGVSIIIALILVFGLAPVFKKAENSPKVMYILMGVLTAIMIAFLLFACLYPFPADTDPHNLLSAKKNAFTLTGCLLGLIVVYTVDHKWTKFDTKAVWWAQIIKVVVGIGLVMAVKEGMRAPLEALLPDYTDTWARMIRYFLMVIVGGVLWPMVFRFFPKPKNKKGGKV